MSAASEDLSTAMPVTTRYPELGTGPIDVKPLIDEDLFKLERDRIFKSTWLLIAREEELAEPGDYKVRDLAVANTSIIVVRDKSGQINAFHNICTHRGNKLISEHGDQCLGRARNNSLTCRFHAWTFATTGRLHGVPRIDNFANFDRDKYALKSVHCATWQGFVFIHLAAHPAQTLQEYLSGMSEQFAGYPYELSTTRFRYATVLKCNWKVALYAFSEAYHVRTIHAATFPSLAKLEHTEFQCFGPHSTSGLYVPPVPGLKPTPATANLGGRLRDSQQHGSHLNELPEKINPAGRQDFQFEFSNFFPNTVFHLCAGNGYPGMTYFMHQFWPISVNETLWEGTNFFRRATTHSEKVAIAHTNALHRNAWLEDTSTMEETQAALESGVLDEMVLMDEEIMIRNTHKHWHDYMGV
ncbi:MAG: aromatic ring-hydroxylating oxygenase subunit alpha [Gammaproteobacteria bacterium]